MRDAKRIPEVLALIEDLWAKVPDWRLGQLVDNATVAGRGPDVFNVEDVDLIAGLKRLVEQYG